MPQHFNRKHLSYFLPYIKLSVSIQVIKYGDKEPYTKITAKFIEVQQPCFRCKQTHLRKYLTSYLT